jgi:hypothetical protein
LKRNSNSQILELANLNTNSDLHITSKLETPLKSINALNNQDKDIESKINEEPIDRSRSLLSNNSKKSNMDISNISNKSILSNKSIMSNRSVAYSESDDYEDFNTLNTQVTTSLNPNITKVAPFDNDITNLSTMSINNFKTGIKNSNLRNYNSKIKFEFDAIKRRESDNKSLIKKKRRRPKSSTNKKSSGKSNKLEIMLAELEPPSYKQVFNSY